MAWKCTETEDHFKKADQKYDISFIAIASRQAKMLSNRPIDFLVELNKEKLERAFDILILVSA